MAQYILAMSNVRNARWLPWLAIFGSVVFLGLGTSWAKHTLFPAVGAQGTTAVRVGFSALILWLLCRPWRWPLSPADRQAVLLYGAALGVMNLSFYMALRTLPFGVAVAIEFSGPLAVAVWASRRALDMVWVLLAVAGLVLLLPLGHAVSSLDPVGVLWSVLAAVCWASYILFGKRIGHLPVGHSVSLGLAMAALVVIPVGVVHAGSALLAPSVLLVGLGVAAVSSAVPLSLEMVALQRLPPQAFGIMISMEPAVAAVLALLLLDEQLSAVQWLAIGLIVLASMGSALAVRRSEPAPRAAQRPAEA